jgi:hypothetical protein
MDVKPLYSTAIPSPVFLSWTETYCLLRSEFEVWLALLLIRQFRIANPMGFGGRLTTSRSLLVAALAISENCTSSNYHRSQSKLIRLVRNNFRFGSVELLISQNKEIVATMSEMLKSIRDYRITINDERMWRVKFQVLQQYLKKAAMEYGSFTTSLLTQRLTLTQDSKALKTSVRTDRLSLAEVMGPLNHSVQSLNSVQALGRGASSPTNPFPARYMRVSGESPFERCTSRYHLSDSPDYYLRDISTSNPLSLLPPLPIQSSSMSKMHVTQNVKDVEEDNESELPSLSDLDLLLDWPPLSERDGIIS